jgi:hypothetical protein
MTQDLPEKVPATGDTSTRKTPRSYLVTLGLLAIGSGALFLGYGRTWSTTRLTESGLPSLLVQLTGRDVQPAGAATAILGLAAIAGLVATRRIGRILSGIVLLVVGVLDAFLAIQFGFGERASIVAAVSERAGRDLDPEIVRAATSTSMWWIAAALGGACFVVAGLLTLTQSSTWPTLGARYERSEQASDRGKRPVSAWDQLDDGIDPTVDLPTSDSSGADQHFGTLAGPDEPMIGTTGTISTSTLREDPQ